MKIKNMQKTLPKGWKWVRLGDVVNVDKGKKMELLSSCLEKSTPYIGIDNLRTNQYTNFTKDKNGLLCIETDLLIVWDGANAGTIGYGLRGYVGSTIARLRPSEESITKYCNNLANRR
jgi:restriction endonuclease S subunit